MNASNFLKYAIIFTVLMYILAGVSYFKIKKYADFGQKALVEVSNQYTETTSTKSKFGIKVSESKTYKMDISFYTKDNHKIIIQNMEIPQDVLTSLSSGDPVYVEYLPNSPYEAHFANDIKTVIDFIIGIALGIVGTFTCILVLIFKRKKS